MTREEAKRRVCRAMAVTLERDLHEIGAGWIYEGDDGEPRPEPDLRRLVAACEELVDELGRRGRLDLERLRRRPSAPNGKETKP